MEAATPATSSSASFPAFATSGSTGLTLSGGAWISSLPPQLTPRRPGPPSSRAAAFQSAAGDGHTPCVPTARCPQPRHGRPANLLRLWDLWGLLQLHLLSLRLLTRRFLKSAAELFLGSALSPAEGKGELPGPSAGSCQTQAHPDTSRLSSPLWRPAALFLSLTKPPACPTCHTSLGAPRKGDVLSWTPPVRAESWEGSSPRRRHNAQHLRTALPFPRKKRSGRPPHSLAQRPRVPLG